MRSLISLSFLLISHLLSGQNIHAVQWINFEALDDSLRQQSRSVVLYFSTEWCSYCRKMDKKVFTRKEIAALLNKQYYAVKMDAETTDTIYFEGQAFVNRHGGNRRPGIHELAQIFSQKERGFVAPTFIILDEEFRVRQRYYEYLHADRLIDILTKQP